MKLCHAFAMGFLFVPLLAAAAERQHYKGDVAQYVGRREGCNHWAGEEGYDADRRAQINKAISDLKCTRLERDEKLLRHRYRHNPAILRQIKKARDAYPD